MDKKKGKLNQFFIISFVGWIFTFIYLTGAAKSVLSFLPGVIPSIQEKNVKIEEQLIIRHKEQAHLERVESLAQQEDLLNEYRQIILRALPEEDEKTSIPLHLDTIASKHNIKISRVIGGATKGKASAPSWVHIDVRILGDYEDCLSFINSLYASNRFTSVESMSISGMGENLIEMAFSVKAYYKGL